MNLYLSVTYMYVYFPCFLSLTISHLHVSKVMFQYPLKKKKKKCLNLNFPTFYFTRPKMSDIVTYITNC